MVFYTEGEAPVAINIFTTRADTVYGVTFMVLAPESEYVSLVTTADQKDEVDKYLLNIGKLAVGEMTDTKTEFEVLYLKLTIDDKERIELDKFNYIYRVEGTDYLAGVRSALGKQG